MKFYIRSALLISIVFLISFSLKTQAQSTDDGIYISSGPDTIQIKKPFTYAAIFEDWDGNGTYVDYWKWSFRIVHEDSVFTMQSKDSVLGENNWQCAWTDSVVHMPLPLDSIHNDFLIIVVECFDSDSFYHTNNKFISTILDSTVLSIRNVPIKHPDNIVLFQNYPNPFNPITTIEYVLKNNAVVSLIMYNTRGQKARVITHEFQTAGNYTTQWDGLTDTGEQAASGVYFYRVTAGDFHEIKKCILIK